MHQAENRIRFDKVLASELDLLEELRPTDIAAVPEGDSVYERAHATRLAGLALSGGGIRSATFNLGLILALSKHGLLSRFDYLSTVSGGGYIGGWLSALLHRGAPSYCDLSTRNVVTGADAVAQFEPNLATHPQDPGFPDTDDDSTSGFRPVEHAAVRYLRRYSRYMAPRSGLSGDLLAVVSLFMRNLVLLQIGLVALLAAVLMLAHILGLWAQQIDTQPPPFLSWLDLIGRPLGWIWPFSGAGLALFAGLIGAGALLVSSPSTHQEHRHTVSQVVLFVVLPGMVAAWWLCMAMFTWPADISLADRGITAAVAAWLHGWLPIQFGDSTIEAVLWIGFGIAGYVGAWAVAYTSQRITGWLTGRPGGQDYNLTEIAKRLFSAIFGGVVLGVLLYLTARFVAEHGEEIGVWYGIAFGTPLVVQVFAFAIAIHIGAARRQFTEQDREWWARLGGMMLLVSLGWVLVFALVLYAPPLMRWLGSGGLAVVAAWATSSGMGAWLARGAQAGKSGTGGWREAAARATPWLFVIGLGVLVAYGVHTVLLAMLETVPDSVAARPVSAAEADPPAGLPGFATLASIELERLGGLEDQILPVLLTWAATLAFFLVFARRFDINLFSLHALYRNRLERAYLGATRPGARRPHPFTGFDPDDDIPFHELAQQRPLPIVNTTINMTGGDDLAWQTRRGASFAFTPLWAGFEAKSSQGRPLGCYRPTKKYAGGLGLAELVAVSGAAASPNMGYHTSPAVAALLTAFNLRLGRWCGNPVREEAWRLPSPKFSGGPILAELTGSATAQAKWIDLTDGGHFENLGIYELVRRRCRLILIGDAGCDPKYLFDDLANSVRKCWTDFGVCIDFPDLDTLRPGTNGRRRFARHACGRIHYKDGKDPVIGLIIYLKASLRGDEPLDVREYADSHSHFPHQSTGDQFFDEDQFEAYRHLGFDIGAEIAGTLKRIWPQNDYAPDFEQWQAAADQHGSQELGSA